MPLGLRGSDEKSADLPAATETKPVKQAGTSHWMRMSVGLDSGCLLTILGRGPGRGCRQPRARHHSDSAMCQRLGRSVPSRTQSFSTLGTPRWVTVRSMATQPSFLQL